MSALPVGPMKCACLCVSVCRVLLVKVVTSNGQEEVNHHMKKHLRLLHIVMYSTNTPHLLFLDLLNSNVKHSDKEVSIKSLWLSVVTFTFSHLADAFVQSDVQGREQSS